jgi:hypothetical protein
MCFAQEVGNIIIGNVVRDGEYIEISFISYDKDGAIIEQTQLTYGRDNLKGKTKADIKEMAVNEIRTRAIIKITDKIKRDALMQELDQIISNLKSLEGTTVKAE